MVGLSSAVSFDLLRGGYFRGGNLTHLAGSKHRSPLHTIGDTGPLLKC